MDRKEAAREKVCLELERRIQETLKVQEKPEDNLQKKMNYLALSKILVFTLDKSQITLINAHKQLGKAYLQCKCNPQAIQHLTIALRKVNLYEDQIDARQGCFNRQQKASIYLLLSKGYLQVRLIEQAFEFANKGLSIQRQIYGQMSSESIDTYIFIAQCHSQKEQFNEAHQTIDNALKICQKFNGSNSIRYSMCLVKKADLYGKQQEYLKAKELQIKAIEILIQEHYSQLKQIPQLYLSLAHYQQKLNDSEGQLCSLFKVRAIYNQLYKQGQKELINVKKQIAEILQQKKRYQQVLQEYMEIYQLQCNCKGDTSVAVGKDCKKIGVILGCLGKRSQGKKYLNKALKIFQQNNHTSMAQAVNQQIKKLKQKQPFKTRIYY